MRDFASNKKYDVASSEFITGPLLRRIGAFCRPYAFSIGVLVSLVALESVCGVLTPFIYRFIINDGILRQNRRIVILLALAAGVVALVNAALTFSQRQLATSISLKIATDARMRLFSHLRTVSLTFFTRAKAGAIVSRLNNEIAGVRDAFTDVISTTVGNAISVIAIVCALFALSWEVASICIFVFALALLVAQRVTKRLRRLTREVHDSAAEMNTFLTERFSPAGALIWRLFAVREIETSAYRARVKGASTARLRLATCTRITVISFALLTNLAVVGLYAWGGGLIISGVMDVGTLVALSTLIYRLYASISSISNAQVDVAASLVAFERIFEILDIPQVFSESQSAGKVPPVNGALRVDGVSFHYPESAAIVGKISEADGPKVLAGPQLQNISFSVDRGKCVAFVGHSGSGKTTIGYLLMRLFDPTSGQISIGGVDLRDIDLEQLRSLVGLVTQESHLFHGTIRENLVYAKPDCSEDSIWRSMEDAQIAEFVRGLPHGIDTIVGERGYRLSGGERQRLAIARMLLKAPAVAVLDEATAHLDAVTERRIYNAMRASSLNRITVIIAHRISAVINADEIIVLSKGQVVQRGSHGQLVRCAGYYRELNKSQAHEAEGDDTLN